MLLLMMWGWGDPGEIRLEGWCMGALRTALRVTRDAHEEAHVERCLWRLGRTENKDSREGLVSRCVWFTLVHVRAPSESCISAVSRISYGDPRDPYGCIT